VLFIAWLMLGFTGAGTLISTAYTVFVLGGPDPAWLGGHAVMLVLAVGLVFAALDRRLSHLAVLHIALAYEVLFCLVAAVLGTWLPYRETGQLPPLTWVTPIIILFPLIVPSPPRVTLTVALVAAATQPLALVLLKTFAGVPVDTARFVGLSIGPGLAVALAYASSRVVHGITVDLANARRMGSYQLESRLGVGGMGEVWRARHQLLARPAAIKLIRPESLTEDAVRQHVILARFEREAQATAAMQSPHTIQLYDFGIAQSGAFYYVMEFLRGLDLEALVDRFGPLPPSRAVYLFHQVCHSLAEAHENGLIHRDIKPANVYLCRYGREVDFVKVLDFGLVRSARDGNGDQIRLTADISVGGTPGFVAPEQVLGKEADGRTDVYSLGCTAYWALTGSYVFQGQTALETVMMHVNTAPQPPSSSSAEAIPPDLDRLVLSCLEKDPEDRPRDADQLADMLAACDVGEPWTQETAKRWWEINMSDPKPAGLMKSGSQIGTLEA
jgi:serine/threonine-protein kinase